VQEKKPGAAFGTEKFAVRVRREEKPCQEPRSRAFRNGGRFLGGWAENQKIISTTLIKPSVKRGGGWGLGSNNTTSEINMSMYQQKR